MTALLTVQEVADLLKTSRRQVQKMIRDGLLPAVRIGREWRVDPHYLQDFLECNMTG
ncbi:MAG: helix-turn-helix domain-containing protein [Pseudoflavonifractor capillosus]|uniref:helix-turn-helix domain-containing protein n=1 Tax=Pseudoflavonifractor capillosus TaxID=106588 RepID=UPI0023F7DD77|nr:helix-turn-helix domain-containing protein [Pseudoflavonifractor capillosus]MCI5928034.1 helix-turn-helix domain-containing protein [Pseudoflavonifractor capillosus]MDY4662128.1 helix-turn-helix domain-containing protein [Pseudoflavonifractor capillosus]